MANEHCGYIVSIKQLDKHPNADRLQIATIFGESVIVGLDTKVGDVGVFFPVDLQLSAEFCKVNDLVRRKDENGNQAGGYLDPDKRNIRALKLRGAKSEGLFLPLTSLTDFTKISDLHEGDTVTEYNGVEICRKYIPRPATHGYGPSRHHKQPKINFVPTFYEHVDTPQLAYNLNAFKGGQTVELTLKMHGTSGRTGYLPLVRTKRSWVDKLLRRHGKDYKEYGLVTGTRRVVLDETHTGGFYDNNDFRRVVEKMFEGKLNKGEVAYYEIVGFTTEGTPIMASVKNSKISDKAFSKMYGDETVFSYGCDPRGKITEHYRDDEDNLCSLEHEVPQFDVYVYRMTMVNEDGFVVEYSPDQMRYRCEQMGIKCVPVFERFIIPYDVDAGEYVVRKVEEYFDGPDPVGKTHVREGVVARIVSANAISVFKHKNFSFKVLEGIAKDEAAAPDMEEAQDLEEEVTE